MIDKEAQIAAVGVGGGLLTWFTGKFAGRWKSRFDQMEKMVNFWQANADRLALEIQKFHGEYERLNKSYYEVIEQNRTLIIENNEFRKKIGGLEFEIKKLKGEAV